MSFRSWVTVITLVLLALVIWLGWPEIVHAWRLLDQVNVWILLLLIPVQLLSYYAVGRVIFSYLVSKGNLKDVTEWTTTRMALELNFVNHILPSGGAAGFSYMGWLLSKHGVSGGRAAMAQIVRYVIMFVSFIAILCLALVVLTLDNHINRVTLLISGSLAVAAIAFTVFAVYILDSRARLMRFSAWVVKTSNRLVWKITKGKKRVVLRDEPVTQFFEELHSDYLEIRQDVRLLKKPFGWSLLANLADVLLMTVAFLALGVFVNPATLFVAFGISGIVSMLSVTPGGAGVYEAIMIAFLVSSGLSPDVAIAGTILARVALLLGTVVFGYVFYQLTIMKYGKKPV